MRLMLSKAKYVVYDDDDNVVIICSSRHICIQYVKQIKGD